MEEATVDELLVSGCVQVQEGLGRERLLRDFIGVAESSRMAVKDFGGA